ncbi:MAG: hypothetical protein R3330_17140, partial [Saprospiraceae bacterium]|nr:hypothetical protein [Saprospiraceae bacterium]
MSRDRMPKLYHPLILQHSRAPSHYGSTSGSDLEIRAVNHYCGDTYRIGFGLDGCITDPVF